MFSRRKGRSSRSRSSYGGYDSGYPPYVPVAEKKAHNERAATALKKKNPGIEPVMVTGRKLAHTWWGIAWNSNLERYADYANRIDRGKSYLRSGAVLDLQIQAGIVTAVVQGSSRSPYQVNIAVDPLKQADWDRIREAGSRQLSSMQALLAGKFPEEMKEMLTERGKGLFPAPKEIHLRCSCPDSATMCKHVAAVLYGIGVRLDERPELFFTLRGRSIDELVQHVVQSQVDTMVEKAGRSSRRALQGVSTDLFGIDFGVPTSPSCSVSSGCVPSGSVPSSSVPSVAAGTVVATSDTAAPKKRGRPRKVLVETPPAVVAPAAVAPAVAAASDTAAPKKRGRPRKVLVETPPAVAAPAVVAPAVAAASDTAAPKKRGRPRKVLVETPPAVAASAVAAASDAAAPKKRGRPRKVLVEAPPAASAAVAPAVVAASDTPAPKKRGRPKKSTAK